MNYKPLTDTERWMVDYLQEWHRTNQQGHYISPAIVGKAYGLAKLGRDDCHSSTSSPVLKRLVEKGYAERNTKGHYRLKPPNLP